MNGTGKNMTKLLSAVLASVIMLAAFIPASTANAAVEPNTPKEEVVYISLFADGSVREINVVNIFDLDADGRIIDYGRYKSVRNMTSTDDVSYKDGTINIDTKAGKLYYEGKLDSNVMPWDISVRYYMDGAEYTAEEIAGKSGALKITVSITENAECVGSFFDGYALQASMTLDGGKCRNISAEGATIANVGADRQLTYIILPGKGAELTITADVTDFETDGISINGIPLNLKIDIDDSELTSDIKRLIHALSEINSGAGAVKDGASDLRDAVDSELKAGADEFKNGAGTLYSGTGELLAGGQKLESGTGELYKGAVSLDDGIKTLLGGIKEVGLALDMLDSNSSSLVEGSAEMKSALSQLRAALGSVSVTADELTKLTDASSAIKSGIDSLTEGVSALEKAASFESYKEVMLSYGLDLDELRANNDKAIESLDGYAGTLAELEGILRIVGLNPKIIPELTAQLQNVSLLLTANNANLDGTEAYLTALNENIVEMLAGTVTLKTNYDKFDAAIGELVNTLDEMLVRLSALTAAVNTIANEYDKLDSGICEYTDAVAEITAGYKSIIDGTAILAEGSGALVSGAETVYSGTGKLVSGISEVYEGAGALDEGAASLGTGVSALIDGITELYAGAGELHSGTSAVCGETSGMDSLVSDRIDDLIGSFTGSGAELTSFVSEENTNINAVQFVIKADGVHTPPADTPADEAEETLSFWQRLLRLFGLY